MPFMILVATPAAFSFILSNAGVKEDFNTAPNPFIVELATLFIVWNGWRMEVKIIPPSPASFSFAASVKEPKAFPVLDAASTTKLGIFPIVPDKMSITLFAATLNPEIKIFPKVDGKCPIAESADVGSFLIVSNTCLIVDANPIAFPFNSPHAEPSLPYPLTSTPFEENACLNTWAGLRIAVILSLKSFKDLLSLSCEDSVSVSPRR